MLCCSCTPPAWKCKRLGCSCPAAADLKFKAVFRIQCSVLKIQYSVFGVRYSE